MSIYTKEEIDSKYNRMVRLFNENNGDMGFSWIKYVNDFAVFNIQEIIPQVRSWRNIGAKAFDYNNHEFDINGRKWYVMIVQPYENGVMKECSMCPVSMLLFGSLVSGYTYAFTVESQRNLIFEILTNDTDQGLINMEQTIAVCKTIAFCKNRHKKEIDEKRKAKILAEETKKAEIAKAELLAMLESDDSSNSSSSSNSNKSKKDNEKERVRKANKARDAEKRKREAFYKKCGMLH